MCRFSGAPPHVARRERIACDAHSYDSLVRALEERALRPSRDGIPGHDGRLAGLFEAVDEMNIFTYPHFVTLGEGNACNRKLKDYRRELKGQVMKVVKKANRRVVEGYRQYLHVQAVKCPVHPCARRPCQRFSTKGVAKASSQLLKNGGDGRS